VGANLGSDPVGAVVEPVPGQPIYAAGQDGRPGALVAGIVVSGSDVRVAVRATVPLTFARVLAMQTWPAAGRARAAWRQAVYPFFARHYANAPGPGTDATYPCGPVGQRAFVDHFATADTACLGSLGDRGLRISPSAGAAFDPLNPGSDPAHHGPLFVLAGVGAEAVNEPSMRGWVNLDVRDFTAPGRARAYNGVDPRANPNAAKAAEAAWAASGGYPGPAFDLVTPLMNGNNQVAVLDGTNAGILLDAVRSTVAPGDELVVPVYSGIVNSIPDVALAPPAQLSLPVAGSQTTSAAFVVARNDAFAGTVTLSLAGDGGSALNPITAGALTTLPSVGPQGFAPSTKGTTATIAGAVSAGAVAGIHAGWIVATPSAPYVAERRAAFPIVVGDAVRDISIAVDGSGRASGPAETVTWSVVLESRGARRPADRDTRFGGTLTLTLEGAPSFAAPGGGPQPLPAGLGPIEIDNPSLSFSATDDETRTATITVNTGTIETGTVEFVLRVTGTNADGQPVTRLVPLPLAVGPPASATRYVEIEGYALVRVAAITANALTGYAISPIYADPTDPALRRGLTPRLVPWT